MALIVESTSSNSVTGSNNLTITKPTGLEVGDLMVAVIGGFNATISTLSGWTLAENQAATTAVINAQYKIAEASDVAASNFTFTVNNNQLNGGSILRVSGQSLVSPLQFSDTGQELNGAGTTIAFSTSVTPVNNSLLVMGYYCQDGTGDATSMNGYYTTGLSTTWTESHDFSADIGGVASPVTAAAYSIISSTSAISTFGAATAIAMDDQAGVFLVINPRVDTTGTSTLVTTTSTAFGQSGTSDTNGSNVLTESTSEAFTQAGRGESPTQWSNEAKPSTTWVNEEL